MAKDNRVARGGVAGADGHRQAKVLDSSVEASPGLQRRVLFVLKRRGLRHVTIVEASVGVVEVSGRGLVVPVFGFITLDQRQALLDGGQEIVRGIDSGRYGGAKLRDEEGRCVHQHGSIVSNVCCRFGFGARLGTNQVRVESRLR